MRAIYENDIIASLGSISGMHKLLYITLWSRADEIGVVYVNLDQILGMTGIRYQMEDFNHFGNRLVFLNEHEVLLTRYLQTTIGTLSKANRSLKTVWKLLEMRWGATKENLAPFVEAWNKLGVGIFAPNYPQEYISEENPGERVLNHRKELMMSKTYDTPYGWSAKIAEVFNEYRDEMIAIAWEKTSKTDIDKFRIRPSNLQTLHEIIQEMINDGVPEKVIVQQIRYSKNKHILFIYTPNAKSNRD